MKTFINIGIALSIMVMLSSCADSSRPNYQYFPNMYESVGYETYSEADFLPNGMEALLPPNHTVKRGWLPYAYENTLEGKELARAALSSPLDSTMVESTMTKGKELYDIYCAVCHGTKGDGQGILMKREKILGVPSYKDRDINVGSTFHVLYYGLNSMGSYASQLNEQERWMVSEYVMKLREDLIK
ncbi:c-type cytochrome [Ascidiimonas sp. W6]|uniref:c-type cytochrome n=1 Tax=Ascidiimonas meishanensis TaxID=3128903 RepID=UPI0030EE963A